MSRQTVAFITLGCKINQYESEAMREEVLGLGYDEVPFTSRADVYVVNTCAVTSTAGAKSRRYIQRVARTNPAARIVVVGCSTPKDREAFAGVPQVALLAGNEEKAMVASFLSGGWRPGEAFLDGRRGALDLHVSRYRGRTRAVVKVQDGCNSFCSFCVIPFLRGLSRSRRRQAVVEEVRSLVDRGFREVIISGVHLEDYGADLDEADNLISLLRAVADVSGLRRLRLSSLGVRAFTRDLLELLENPVFCRHFHIPLQAGSDTVLERMRRRYTVNDYRRVLRELRARFNEPSITTDVIVGHPGETEPDFDRTLELCRELRFPKIHVFPYSVREGTLASKMKDPVDSLEVRRRTRLLAELERELGAAYRRRFLGRVVEVLVEGSGGRRTPGGGGAAGPRQISGADSPVGHDPVLEGLTDRYVRVRFPAPSLGAAERFPGTLEAVRVTASDDSALWGTWAGGVSLGVEPESRRVP